MTTREEALAIYESEWWVGLPDKEVVRRQLFENRVIMPFGLFHEKVEAVLGRGVWTHEFANPTALQQELEKGGNDDS